MKKTLCIITASVALLACNDDFLERYPQTSIVEKNFFKTVADLETYSNQFYDYLYVENIDRNTDNTTIEKGNIRSLMLGTITADNAGGWDWGSLRAINTLLDNSLNIEGDDLEINKFKAVGKFFRARFYIDKVKTYSDVPWYGKVLTDTDIDLLYKARDTREIVVDSIIADLEYATKYMGESKHKTRFSKWAAFTELARFCLYEGTYRKYHEGEADLHVVKTPEYFLNKAIAAASEVMESKKFDIYSTSNFDTDYGSLFKSYELNDNCEVIMYLAHEENKRENNSGKVLDYENGISRSFVDSYLYKDGSFVPRSVTDTLQINYIFENRDPRLKQSIMYPGYVLYKIRTHKLPINKTGGYGQIKFLPDESKNHLAIYVSASTSLPLYRYAELLLIYAEAKAEMGELTQADLDKTINVLRRRAGMSNLLMNPPVDPMMAEMYNNIKSTQSAELLEIRRERNIELFAEGFRYDDLMRWKMGKVYEFPQQGIYVPKSGLVDITGDGSPDYYICDTDENIPSDLPGDISIEITSKSNIPYFLEYGDHGHIMFKAEKNGLGSFVEPKYYYRPVPTSQLNLNKNLKQIFDWD